MEPSAYQQAIFDALANTNDHLMIEAVAGSGKTTTIIWALDYLPDTIDIGLTSFNQAIAAELDDRAGSRARARTMHSIGAGALNLYLVRQGWPDGFDLDRRKMRKMAQRWLEYHQPGYKQLDFADRQRMTFDLSDLTQLTRRYCLDPTDLEALTNLRAMFGLSADLDAVPVLLEESYKQALGQPSLYYDRGRQRLRIEHPVIDFDEMLWMPWRLRLHLPKFDCLFVDEAQDLSRLQFEIARGSVAHGGRMIFFGDPHQAIYGFNGADYASMQRIRDMVQPRRLPLSVSYRCARSIIELAQTVVPAIENRPNAPQGTVKTVHEEAFYAEVQPGDMVISRLWAPIITAAVRLIQAQDWGDVRPLYVAGRRIGYRLIAIVDAVMEQFEWDEFIKGLAVWQNERIAYLHEIDADEDAFQEVDDQMLSISAVHEGLVPQNAEELKQQIKDLFKKTSEGAIRFSTVHGAKGLEANRVWIMAPDKLPLDINLKKESWRTEQEYNLLYVAITRAKHELLVVFEENSYDKHPVWPVKHLRVTPDGIKGEVKQAQS